MARLSEALRQHQAIMRNAHRPPERVSFGGGPWAHGKSSYIGFDPEVSTWTARPDVALGALGAAKGGDLLAQVNALIAQALPPQAHVAIDASPLTLMQKQKLKKEPLSVFILLADKSQGAVIEFIERVALGAAPKPVAKWGATRSSNAKSSVTYSFGGTPVKVNPKKTDLQLSLALQFLATASMNVVKAHQVALAMVFEAGISEPFKVVNAVVASEIKNVVEATDNLVQSGMTAAQKAMQDAQKAAQSLFQMPKFFGVGALGDSGAVSGPLATLLASSGISTSGAFGTFVGFVDAAILTAPLSIPILVKVMEGVNPSPPSSANIQASANAASTVTSLDTPASIKNAVADSDKILGLPRPVAYAGAGVLALGGAWWAYNTLRKRRRSS